MPYDLIVIGGGPAGMMAAGRAGESGARVLLLEKNKRPGAKLLLTGNGRCNLTNDIGAREMIGAFGLKGKFLFSALSRFDARDAMDFFQKQGVRMKTEEDRRVFPASGEAQDVLKALMDYLRSSKVDIITGAEVKKIASEKNKIMKIILADGKELSAKNFVVAVGGKAYPQTGSTGDGYGWLSLL